MKPNKPTNTVPPIYLKILNQLYDMEARINNSKDCETAINHIKRNIERMNNIFLDLSDMNGSSINVEYFNPMNQKYDDTRNDLDANIIGESTDNLVVVDVIKPIIKAISPSTGISFVIQKGMVSVKSNNTSNDKGENNE